MLTRCFWPPDSSKIERSPKSARPTSARASAWRARISSARAAKVLEAETDFVAHAGIDDLAVWILEHHADFGGEIGDLRVGDDFPQMIASPVSAPPQDVRRRAVQQMEQRALAAAARAEDQDEFACRDLQRNIAQDRRGLALVGVGDAREIDQHVVRLRGIRPACLEPADRPTAHCVRRLRGQRDGA